MPGKIVDYFAIQPETSRKYCVLGDQPEEIADYCHRLIEGIALGDKHPQPAPFRMSPYSGGIVTPDYVKNPFGYFILSEKLRTVVGDVGLAQEAEFLPIAIIDHKGRNVDGTFHIMNLLATIDCLDRTETLGEVDELEPRYYQWIDRLVLDPAQVPADVHLFRIEGFPKLHLASERLRSRCIEAGVTGIEFVPTGLERQFT